VLVSYETLLLEVKDSVATVTLNRPDSLNAMSEQMWRDFRCAFDEIFAAPGIRALVLSGAGRAFSAGADLKSRVLEKATPGARQPEEVLFELATPVFKMLRDAPVPTIAAVNGACAGAGVSLALSCDLVIAARSAFFLQAYINLGLGPDMGGSWFVVRSVGAARAFELFALGERLSAQKAADWGLIHRCVDDMDLMSEAGKLSGKLASGPTKGYIFIRELNRAACTNDLQTQIELERQYYFSAKATDDACEAQRAYAEKRPPIFKGR
jgi:2-(1,2-epoxy-1,2-dihydrophenyl)acetyl-CoA isomerase